jgi:hypothetical protein
MDAKRALRHAGKYTLLKALATVVGLAPVAAGGYNAYRLYTGAAAEGGTLGGTFYGSLGLAAVGLFLWQFLSAWALYTTLTDAITEDVSDTYDTTKVKSDILSVVDDRITDVQNDINQVNRSIQDITRPDEEFRFED